MYTSRAQFSPTDLQEYLEDVPFPVLSDSYRKRLEAGITLVEVHAAIGGLQGGKTPGADRLPMEFYSQYVDLLAPRLTALFSEFTKLELYPNPWMKLSLS